MEAARTEPVKITHKSGEAFVLVNADAFEKMQIDLVYTNISQLTSARSHPTSSPRPL